MLFKICLTRNNGSRTWHRMAVSRCWASMDQIWTSKWNFFNYPPWRLLHCFSSTGTKDCFSEHKLLLHIQLVDTFIRKRSGFFTLVAYEDPRRRRNSERKGIRENDKNTTKCIIKITTIIRFTLSLIFHLAMKTVGLSIVENSIKLSIDSNRQSSLNFTDTLTMKNSKYSMMK